MKTERESLIEVLEEAKLLLARPENDFGWSRWNEGQEALAALDGHIAKARKGDWSAYDDLALLFAPTGSIQEVSVSSGWGEEFIKLATRFDTVKRPKQPPEPTRASGPSCSP